MPAQRPGLADLSDDDRQELESWLVEFDQNWGDGLLSGRVEPDPARQLVAPPRAGRDGQDRPGAAVAGAATGSASNRTSWTSPSWARRDDVSADLIQAEYEVRRQFGAPADLEEYARRFPHQAEELRLAVGLAVARRPPILPSAVSVRRPARPASGASPSSSAGTGSSSGWARGGWGRSTWPKTPSSAAGWR